MAKIFAIGDIHGCHKNLEHLFKIIPFNKREDTLLFLGDYINRGPRVKEVLELILNLRGENIKIIALMGNHEHLLLEYHKTRFKSLLPYLRNLGIENTLASYGGASLNQLGELSFMPETHKSFLLSLLPYYETREYIFVHAGIKPGYSLEQQDLADFLEMRDQFLQAKTGLNKRVIFGHTPFASPLVLKDKIGIDTGAVYGNYLTALELPRLRFYHSYSDRL